VAGKDTEGMKGAAGDTGNSLAEGSKGAVKGGADTVTGTARALGEGAKSGAGALGGMTGLGGK
jgi:hypothetical protein